MALFTDERKKSRGEALIKPIGPLIVASVVDVAGLRRVMRARRPPWDIVEFRVDRLGQGAEVRRALQVLYRSGVPLLITIRSQREGGAWRWGERRRTKAYERLMEKATLVDIEIRSESFRVVSRMAAALGVLVIGSFHDFSGTPSVAELERIAREGWSEGADVVKLATTVRAPEDRVALKSLLRRFRKRKLCVIGMERRGLRTRVELARAGSWLVYGAVGRAAVPGQPSCSVLRKALAAC